MSEASEPARVPFTLVRRGGRWLVAAFHNTEMSAHAKRRYADQAPAEGA